MLKHEPSLRGNVRKPNIFAYDGVTEFRAYSWGYGKMVRQGNIWEGNLGQRGQESGILERAKGAYGDMLASSTIIVFFGSALRFSCALLGGEYRVAQRQSGRSPEISQAWSWVAAPSTLTMIGLKAKE